MEQKLELLSPAGDLSCFLAAVHNGADAVYLGSKLFNARRLAGNFSDSDLRIAVQYAHFLGKKVYLTLNTLVKNNEISAFLYQLAIAAQLHIDAVIIQDLSFSPFIKKYFPQLEVHASTQSTIMNSAAVHYWKKYVDVFVLARELTKSQVKQINDQTHVHLEFFVHGHLCISYSGQCLISSLIGKRSGNRGLCASSCRKQYNGEGYLLSAKDLCMIKNIKDVSDAGIKTVKIEGRMKSPEYVAITTKKYRDQIDALFYGKKAVVSDFDVNQLKLAFNREFTSGYFNNETQIVDSSYAAKRGVLLGIVNHGNLKLEADLQLHDGVGIISHGKRTGDFVKEIIFDGLPVQAARKGDYVKLSVQGFVHGAKVYLMTQFQGKDIMQWKLPSQLGLFITLQIKEQKEVVAVVGINGKELSFSLDTVAMVARKHPLTQQDIEQEFAKYESSMFFISQLFISTDNSFLPISKITNFRKKLDQLLLDQLYPVQKELLKIPAPVFSQTIGVKKKLHVQVYYLAAAVDALEAGADVIYYDAFAVDALEVAQLVKEKGKEFFLYTPMVLVDKDIIALETLLQRIKPDGVLINNVGVLALDLPCKKVLGYQMNVFNDLQLQQYGCDVIASIELNLQELQAFSDKARLIYYAHGRPVVMTFKEKFSDEALTDEVGYTFPLRQSSTGAIEMLYSNSIGLLQHTSRLLEAGISQFYLDLENDVFELVSLYRQLLNGKDVSVKQFKGRVTMGNLAKGVL